MNKDLFNGFPPVLTKDWEEQIKRELKGADYEKKLIWNTPEGFRIKPYYRAEDLSGLEYLKSNPGAFPYIRGSEVNNNQWEIREDIENSDIEEANIMAKEAISKGATSLGLNASKVETSKQLSSLLLDIDLTKTSIHFISSKSYLKLAELFLNEVKKKGFNPKQIHGSFNFDPIGYYIINGRFYNNQEANFNEAHDLFHLISEELPHFKLITVNGQHFHNAGAYLVQVLPFTLSVANEYLVRMTDLGLSVDTISSRMQFVFAISANYFLEIAKLRSARLLWAKIVEQYKPSDKHSTKMHIHATSSVWNKTVFDPYVNMLRNTTETMSAAIGGADSISVLPFDAVYKETDAFSKRNARNTQLLLKEESYLDKIVDPAAGSYYIETLTDGIAEKSWELFKSIEITGGFIQYFESGKINEEINDACQQRDMDIATRKVKILGTNMYPNPDDQMLEKITKLQSGKENPNGLRLYRGAESFEFLRLATEKHAKKTGKKPKVFLLQMGNLAMRKARATFSMNFFGCAGYEIIDNNFFKETNEAVEAALASKSEIIVVCSSDDEYLNIVPPICKGIKDKNDNVMVIVAGYPKEVVDDLKNAAVDDFIHLKTNVLSFLMSTQRKLGIDK